MIELFLAACVTYFVVVNPAGVAVTFATLSEGMDAGWRAKMAMRAVFVAGLILAGFAFGGQWLLAQLGVSLDAFRMAGGALLFLIAVDMLFERRQQRREATAQQVVDARAKGEQDDISVFPLAIPLTAGPGAIATTLLFMTNYPSLTDRAVILGAAGAILVITLVALLTTTQLTRLMGATVLMVATRVFGIMLAAIAAQFLTDGIRGAFGISQ